jgi:hypothetical protein
MLGALLFQRLVVLLLRASRDRGAVNLVSRTWLVAVGELDASSHKGALYCGDR